MRISHRISDDDGGTFRRGELAGDATPDEAADILRDLVEEGWQRRDPMFRGAIGYCREAAPLWERCLFFGEPDELSGLLASL